MRLEFSGVRAAAAPWKQRSWLTFCIDPVGIQIRESRLITDMLYRLGWLGVQQATRPSPPAFVALTHRRTCGYARAGCQRMLRSRRGLGAGGKGEGTREKERRQLGDSESCSVEVTVGSVT